MYSTYLYQILVSSSFLAIGVTVLYIQKPVLPILIGIRCYFSTNITYCSSIGNFLCFFFKQNTIQYTRKLKIGLCYVCFTIFLVIHSGGFLIKSKSRQKNILKLFRCTCIQLTFSNSAVPQKQYQFYCSEHAIVLKIQNGRINLH